MDGRFPYGDPNNAGRGQQQQDYGQLSAQMRAALGLTGGSSIEEALYLQQQQRQQDLQRERLRQMLLQEQFGQQNNYDALLQEQQMRALGEHLHDYPDLQQHYHNLLLREHLQRQDESSILEQLRYQEELRRHQLQMHQQQESLSSPQAHPQSHAHAQEIAEAQARARAEAQAHEFAEAQARARAESQAQGRTHAWSHSDGEMQAHAQAQAQSVPSSVAKLRDLAADSLAGNAMKKSETERKRSSPDEAEMKGVQEESQPPPTKRHAKEPKEKVKKPKAKSTPKSKKKSSSQTSSPPPALSSDKPPKDNKKPKKTAKATAKQGVPAVAESQSFKKAPRSTTKQAPKAGPRGSVVKEAAMPPASFQARQEPAMPPTKFHPPPREPAVSTTEIQSAPQEPAVPPTKFQPPRSQKPSKPPGKFQPPSQQLPPHTLPFAPHQASPYMPPQAQQPSPVVPPMSILEHVAEQSELLPVSVPRLGTVQGLLDAAVEDNDVDTAIGALKAFKGVTSSDLEERVIPKKPRIAKEKQDSVHLPNGFTSALPLLPEEPLWEEEPADLVSREASSAAVSENAENMAGDGNGEEAMEIDQNKPKTRVVSNVLDYPYPIDVWWPSVQAIRRERKEAGYASDEDNFEEETSMKNEHPRLSANLPAIKARLSQDLRPGVLEKMPHCKLHRVLMKKKKNLSAPELVYCWQVTDIYPNNLMVCCSVCGTWRHAACGGHHKPYSARENTEEPFIAVCDLCHEEEKIVCDYPVAQKRIEKQRMEQLRRGLTTSAVMRHASFSKHGGTYKWPLGRVSATHMGGHTRSVHSRHDKAEKQWADMVSRLSRGHGQRPRERARVRTKELERLLVSVEDAESYTDRHNILLFLMRDTINEHPVGFENERRNIFDPEEDQVAMQDEPEAHAQEISNLNEKPSAKGKGGNEGGKMASKEDVDEQPQTKEPSRCAREGCTNKPRFDSMFCSDSCGVAALESDLLRSFQESSDIHPSVLRN